MITVDGPRLSLALALLCLHTSEALALSFISLFVLRYTRCSHFVFSRC